MSTFVLYRSAYDEPYETPPQPDAWEALADDLPLESVPLCRDRHRSSGEYAYMLRASSSSSGSSADDGSGAGVYVGEAKGGAPSRASVPRAPVVYASWRVSAAAGLPLLERRAPRAARAEAARAEAAPPSAAHAAHGAARALRPSSAHARAGGAHVRICASDAPRQGGVREASALRRQPPTRPRSAYAPQAASVAVQLPAHAQRPRTASQQRVPASKGAPDACIARSRTLGALPLHALTPCAPPTGTSWLHRVAGSASAAREAAAATLAQAAAAELLAGRRPPTLSGGGSGNNLELQKWQLQEQQSRRALLQSAAPRPLRPATAGERPSAHDVRARLVLRAQHDGHGGAHVRPRAARAERPRSAAAPRAREAGPSPPPARMAVPPHTATAGRTDDTGAPPQLPARAGLPAASVGVAYAKTTLRIFEPHETVGSFLQPRGGALDLRRLRGLGFAGSRLV
ncbi:hypothetical protein KFE25_009087 [Diacronema lutheri]|uniref:Uncharacterized protein n=1 Tax=Diacronema lutheri TaxID=2081491 RepID=A0A8J5XK09_DIALT|nr:hypothetical protein KFE25_009087 [Diacronema lutheri]